MTRAHWLLIPLLLFTYACEATDPTPYPYMPQFVAPSDVPPRVLPIPPAKDSAEYNKEIDSIIATQHKLTEAQKLAIKAEDHIRPEMIVLPVIGAQYTEEKYPATYNLLRHAASDAWRDADYTQDYWQRTRPWMVDERVELLVNHITRPSYPSGHSTTNHVWAHILSDLFPEQQDALFARAYEIGMDRVAAGAHFPSDVDAGRRYASFIYDKMSKNPQFQTELAAAHAEINAGIQASMPPIVVVHPDPQPLPPSMVPAAAPSPEEAMPLPSTPVAATPVAPVPTPAPGMNSLGTPYPGRSQMPIAAPVVATPPPAPVPAPVVSAPASKGNLPVDCMHPQPGELQTGCR